MTTEIKETSKKNISSALCTLLEHRLCCKADRQRTNNQMHHIAISSNCLLDIRNKRGVDTGLETCFRLGFAFATSRRVGELRVPRFNTDGSHDPALGRYWRNYLFDPLVHALNSLPLSIDESRAATKSVFFFSGTTQVVGYFLKRRPKTQLTAQFWKRIDEHRKLKVILVVTSGGERSPLEL